MKDEKHKKPAPSGGAVSADEKRNTRGKDESNNEKEQPLGTMDPEVRSISTPPGEPYNDVRLKK